MKQWVFLVSHIVFGAIAGGVYEAFEVEEFVPGGFLMSRRVTGFGRPSRSTRGGPMSSPSGFGDRRATKLRFIMALGIAGFALFFFCWVHENLIRLPGNISMSV